MTLPFVAACVSANGSVMALRYEASVDGDGAEAVTLAQHTDGPGFALPINIMISDRSGEAVRVTIEQVATRRSIRFMAARSISA